MSDHSPEPWLIGEPGTACFDDLAPPERKHYLYADSLGKTVHHVAVRMSGADARRIVACVNACQGISNEVLADLGQFTDWLLYPRNFKRWDIAKSMTKFEELQPLRPDVAAATQRAVAALLEDAKKPPTNQRSKT